MNPLEHSLERTIVVGAPRATTFRCFIDPGRFAAWWGAGSSLDGRPGGPVQIRYPNAVTASGEVVEIDPGVRLVFTFGYDSGQPIPAGSSRVTIGLADDPAGSRLLLRHDFADAAARDAHAAGWRYQLARLANVAADEAQRDVSARVDAWFDAWAEADATRRRTRLAECVDSAVTFRDPYACVAGRDDLDAHIAASQFFMPGVAMRREGAPRHCQGAVLVDWSAAAPDGSPRGRGTNLFLMTPAGLIAGAVGFWGGAG